MSLARGRDQPPRPPIEWSDEELINIFCRVPYLSQGRLRCVCTRIKMLLASSDFTKGRLDSGYAERGLVVVGHEGMECTHRRSWLHAGGRWIRRAEPRIPRSLACSAIVDNELWLCGGVDYTLVGSAPIVLVDAYDLATNAWRSLPELRLRRAGAVCGVVGGALVVAGGGSGSGPILKSAEAFRFADREWRSIADLPHGAMCATACVLQGKLFVAGGVHSNKLQMWDGEKWTLKAELPAVRHSALSAVYNDRMMVMGGFVGIPGDEIGLPLECHSVELYNPTNDTWVPGPRMPFGCFRGGDVSCEAVNHDDAVIVVGGGGHPSLKFARGRWSALPNFYIRHASAVGSMLLL